MFHMRLTQMFSDSVRAVLPCIHLMLPEEQEEFLEDYIEIVREMGLIEPNDMKSEPDIVAPYKLLVVYARK